MSLAQTSRPAGSRQPIRPRLIVAASIGNALEFYDFTTYAFFAAWIAAAFFPGHDQTSKLLLTFGTFGVSFLARPVGAFVLGAYADRRGRVASMTLSIGLMTLGCLMIALMPTYSAIGLAAPLGILLARLIQGFSLGGEYGSSTAFLIEHAPKREAWAASWQSTSQIIASSIASGLAWLLATLLPPTEFHSVGFRIAIGVGALVGPFGWYLRRRMPEPDSFLAAERPPETKAEHAGHDGDRTGTDPHIATGIAIAACLVALGTGMTYLTVYLPTYAVQQLHLTAGKALGTICLGYLALLATTPLRLMIANWFDGSSRLSRVRIMLISCVLLMLVAYPVFILLNGFPSGSTLFLIPFGLNVLGLFYVTPLPAFMGMVFSIRHRGVGLSVGYALGVALFGGFAPFINEWLISVTGDPKSPAAYLVAVALLTILALLSASRRLRLM